MTQSSRLPGGIAAIAVCAILLMAIVVPVTAGMSGTLETHVEGSCDLDSSDRMVQSSDVSITVSRLRSPEFYVTVGETTASFGSVSPGFVVLSPSMAFSCRASSIEVMDMATGTVTALDGVTEISQSASGLHVECGPLGSEPTAVFDYPGNPWVMYTWAQGFPAATHAATSLPAMAGDGVMAYADRTLATASATWFDAVPDEGYEFDHWEFPEGPLPDGETHIYAHFRAAEAMEPAPAEKLEEGGEAKADDGWLTVSPFNGGGSINIHDSWGSYNTLLSHVNHVQGLSLGYGDGGPGSVLYLDPVQVPATVSTYAIFEHGSAYGPGGASYAVSYTQTDYEGQSVQAVASVAVPASEGHAVWYAPLEWEASASADPVLTTLLAAVPLICAAALLVLVCRWALPGREGGDEDVFNSR